MNEDRRAPVQLFDAGSRDTPTEVSNRVLTVPNLLSLARLLILPWLYLVIVDGRFLLGLVVGFVFGASDFVDGYVARRFDQVTRLGQLLDPFSDRLFIVVLAIALVVAGAMPLWLALLIGARDVLLLVGGLAMMGRGAKAPPVTRPGKAATFGMMWSFPFMLVGAHLTSAATGEVAMSWTAPWGWVTMVGIVLASIAAALYWYVGIGYARTVLGASPDVA